MSLVGGLLKKMELAPCRLCARCLPCTRAFLGVGQAVHASLPHGREGPEPFYSKDLCLAEAVSTALMAVPGL